MPAFINSTYSTAETADPAGITSLSVAGPSGGQNGDLLLITVCIEHFSQTNNVTPPPSAGLEQMDLAIPPINTTSYFSVNTGGQWLYRKALTGPAASSYNFTFSIGSYYAAIFAIILSGDFVDVVDNPPVANPPYIFPFDIIAGGGYALNDDYFYANFEIHRSGANPVATIYTQMAPALWDVQLADLYSGSPNFNDHVQFLGGFYDGTPVGSSFSGGNTQGTGAIPSAGAGTHYYGIGVGITPGTRVFVPGGDNLDEKIFAYGMTAGLGRGWE